MRTRILDGKVVLDGDQTFVAFMEIAGQEITDEVFIENGTLHDVAICLLEMAVSALNNTVITSGWRPK